VHDAPSRLSRLLLVLSEQGGDDTISFSQERLADMLGLRRPSVTAAAQTLQSRRLNRAKPHVDDGRRFEHNTRKRWRGRERSPRLLRPGQCRRGLGCSPRHLRPRQCRHVRPRPFRPKRRCVRRRLVRRARIAERPAVASRWDRKASRGGFNSNRSSCGIEVVAPFSACPAFEHAEMYSVQFRELDRLPTCGPPRYRGRPESGYTPPRRP
jgi:hypothetical protein